MSNQSFEAWWSSFWTSPMQPKVIDDMFLELAQQAWNAAND